jgi:hypothetical protein
MTHPRTIIRNRIQEILVAANVAGGNVRSDGLIVETLIEKDLPVVGIWIPSDNVDAEDPGPRRRTNTVQVFLQCVVVPGDDVQDKVDALEMDIMAVLDRNRYLDGDPREYTNDSRKVGSSIALMAMGDRVTGFLELEYTMEYLDHAPAFETATTPFQKLEGTYNPNGTTDPGDQPSDLQTFPGAP